MRTITLDIETMPDLTACASAGVNRADGFPAWPLHQVLCVSLLTHDPALTPLNIRQALSIHEEIVHITVEIHRCDACPA